MFAKLTFLAIPSLLVLASASPSSTPLPLSVTGQAQCVGMATWDPIYEEWEIVNDNCWGTCGGGGACEVVSNGAGTWTWCGCDGDPPIAPTCCFLRINQLGEVHTAGVCFTCPTAGGTCGYDHDQNGTPEDPSDDEVLPECK